MPSNYLIVPSHYLFHRLKLISVLKCQQIVDFRVDTVDFIYINIQIRSFYKKQLQAYWTRKLLTMCKFWFGLGQKILGKVKNSMSVTDVKLPL